MCVNGCVRAVKPSYSIWTVFLFPKHFVKVLKFCEVVSGLEKCNYFLKKLRCFEWYFSMQLHLCASNGVVILSVCFQLDARSFREVRGR